MQRGVAIGDYRRERLVDYMSDGGGHFSYGAHARDMRQICLRFLQRFFSALALRDIATDRCQRQPAIGYWLLNEKDVLQHRDRRVRLEMPEAGLALPGPITLERRQDLLLKPIAILRWQILKYVDPCLNVALQSNHRLAGTIDKCSLAVE